MFLETTGVTLTGQRAGDVANEQCFAEFCREESCLHLYVGFESNIKLEETSPLSFECQYLGIKISNISSLTI